MREGVHEAVAGLQLEQEREGAGRRIQVRQQNFLFGIEPLELKSQIAGQGGGPTSSFAGHDAVHLAQLARLNIGIELDAFEPVEGGADLFQSEGLKKELAGAVAQAPQNDVRIVALID